MAVISSHLPFIVVLSVATTKTGGRSVAGVSWPVTYLRNGTICLWSISQFPSVPPPVIYAHIFSTFILVFHKFYRIQVYIDTCNKNPQKGDS